MFEEVFCVINLFVYTLIFGSVLIQLFSPVKMPLLAHLNLRGNPLDDISDKELMEFLKRFPSLTSLEVFT